MPLLIAAPTNTPMAATMMIRLNVDALDPTAEDRKLTASLLTPTAKSNIASKNRNITMPKNNISIYYRIFFYTKFGNICCQIIKLGGIENGIQD